LGLLKKNRPIETKGEEMEAQDTNQAEREPKISFTKLVISLIVLGIAMIPSLIVIVMKVLRFIEAHYTFNGQIFLLGIAGLSLAIFFFYTNEKVRKHIFQD
jgi:hypothetical protein